MSNGTNQISDHDFHWMQRALELARRGIGVTSPNPAVGCVILDRAGQVVGEGWHEYDLARPRRNRRPQRSAAARRRIAFAAARPTSRSSPAASPAARRPAPMRSSRPASPASSPPPSIPTPPSPATDSTALRAAGIRDRLSALAKPKPAASTRASRAGSSTTAPSC